MTIFCGCEMPGAERRVGCQECGTACCRSCSIEIGVHTYCRWCAPALAPLA